MAGSDSHDALTELQNLLLQAPDVRAFLRQVTEVAQSVVPAAACGITMRCEHEPITVASGNELASQVDELQYGRGQGPCLQTLHTGRPVLVPDVSGENRWGDYPTHALAHGVRSSLSLPLVADGVVVGAMNLYATEPRHFADRQRERAQAFAQQASTALTLVLRNSHHVQLELQLREAMSARSVIDQAIGIIICQKRCSGSEAFAVLREASQHRNRPMRDIAADFVESVSGSPPEPPRPFTERP